MRYLALLVLLCGVCRADVNITENEFVHNDSGVSCVWCSMETIGRDQNIKSLYRVAKEEKGPVNMASLIYTLNQRRVRYVATVGVNSECTRREFIENPCRRGLGSGVILKQPGGTHHMVVVVKYDAKNKDIRVVDSNYDKFQITKLDWEQFHSDWIGCAIYLPERFDD